MRRALSLVLSAAALWAAVGASALGAQQSAAATAVSAVTLAARNRGVTRVQPGNAVSAVFIDWVAKEYASHIGPVATAAIARSSHLLAP